MNRTGRPPAGVVAGAVGAFLAVLAVAVVATLYVLTSVMGAVGLATPARVESNPVPSSTQAPVGEWAREPSASGSPLPTVRWTPPATSEPIVTQAPQPETTVTVTVPAPAPATVVVTEPSYPLVEVSAGKECQRVGTGPYAAAGTANATTSCPFAVNVREAYVRDLNGADGQVIAYSPTTKLTYTMECSGQQPVLCTGGRAGRVIIYGGQLRVG